MRFAKGHGTENDFVILPDPDGLLELTPHLVARLCDRRSGLGGDGVLRVVRTAAVAGAAAMPEVSDAAAAAVHSGWFMDYRNADGSIAEMCGNGIRVFARYLAGKALVRGDEFTIGTRAGLRLVRLEPGGNVTVEMGPARILGHGRATIGDRVCDGVCVSVGNPHLACLVDSPLDEFDLSVPPRLDPGQFPEGANIELVRVTDRAAVQLRVRERGSGETRSCGTGAVAAVAAAQAACDGVIAWRVGVPGGELLVRLDDRTSWLTGPAVIVAEGELSDEWLSAAGSAK